MDNYNWLNYHTKCFTCDGNNIDILKSPTHFYEILKEKIQSTNKRIIWSSLYLGTGKLEKELVELILERCHNHKTTYKNKSFTFLCLIDYLRGSRPVKNIHRLPHVECSKDENDLFSGRNLTNSTPAGPLFDGIEDYDSGIYTTTTSDKYSLGRDIIRIPPKFISDTEEDADRKRARYSSVVATFPSLLTNETITSRDMLLPLIKRYPEYASVYLYQSPKFNFLKKILLPGALKEIAGLNHVKAYIFDDDVIISGANLSETYFTNRQDRYILIRDCKELCDHLEIFIRLLCKFSSHRLLPDDTTFDMIKLSRQISQKRRKSFKKLEKAEANYDEELQYLDMTNPDSSKTDNNRLNPEETNYYMNNIYGKSNELGYKIRQLFAGNKFKNWVKDEIGKKQKSPSTFPLDLSSRRWSLLPFIEHKRWSGELGNDEMHENLILKDKVEGQERELSYGSIHRRNTTVDPTFHTIPTTDESFRDRKILPINTNTIGNILAKQPKTNGEIHKGQPRTPLFVPDNPKHDTFLYPLIQAKPHGVNDEYNCMTSFFNSVGSGSRLWLSSGYFNLVPEYTDILLNRNEKSKDKKDSYGSNRDSKNSANHSSNKTYNNQSLPSSHYGKSLYAANILFASPEANGFHGAKGFKKYVPLIYVYASRLFYEKLRKSERLDLNANKIPNSDFDNSRKSIFNKLKGSNSNEDETDNGFNQISLWEYTRKSWTYHAKGLWLYPLLERFPNFTMFGSSNYGYRSVYRDLELQIALYTTNSSLKQKLHQELDEITDYTFKVTDESFAGPDRKIPLWLKLFFHIMKAYF